MSIEIGPLAQADIPGAVECVQQAFSDDPYFRWAFDNPSKVWNVPTRKSNPSLLPRKASDARDRKEQPLLPLGSDNGG